jgi:4-aminobutyrate aminotransferase-like enzyme
MVKTYVRPPPMFVKGEGCYLWDVENRKYLDLTAGIAVNALGHCDPEMSKLIAQQVDLISPSIHSSRMTDIKFSAGQDAYTHLESLPQPVDRGFILAACTKNIRRWRDALGFVGFHLQLGI